MDPKSTAFQKEEEIDLLVNTIKRTDKSIKRLENIKEEVVKGNLNTAKYQEIIRNEDMGSSFTTSLSDPEQEIVDQYAKLNTELVMH